MTLVTVPELSRRPQFNGFYVPRFELKVSNNNLPESVLSDVVELTYKDNVKEIDSFELVINNWEPNSRQFKYVGSETAADLQGNGLVAQRYKLFEPCDKIAKLSIGYGDQLQQMMVGHFTTLEPSFPSSGPPTLTVQGLNRLHSLRTKQFTYAWVQRTPAQIVQELSALRDGNQPRFPIPIDVEAGSGTQNAQIPYIAQDNQYDIDFLLNLARQYGYEVFVRTVNGEERLYFGPSAEAPPEETLKLVWGQSIVDFRPTITAANQLKKVTVRGWDRHRKEPITATIDVTDPEFERLNPDLRQIIQCNPREEQVVDLPVFSEANAMARARNLLLRRQQAFVKATVKTIGNPMLRAGTRLKIEGVGSRLSGTYFVDESKHTIGSNAYITEFKAHREDEGGTTQEQQAQGGGAQ
jgi:phage protein D